jgi:hypothetical protein
MLDYDKLTVYCASRRETLINDARRVRVTGNRSAWSDPVSKRLRNRLGELLIMVGNRLKETPPQPLEQLELAHR